MRLLFFLLLISLSSCASYYDDLKVLESKEYRLSFGDNINTYTALERTPAKADREIYYPQKFSIDLPKKIKGFMILGNDHVFEYDNKQIISVNAGYSNKNSNLGEWRMQEPLENDLFEIVNYYKNKKYSERIFDHPYKNRKTLLYTNGEVRIIIFNVKNDNFEQFLNVVNSFRYLD